MSPSLVRLAPVLLAACAVLAVGAQPGAAAVPCWKKLMNDWYSPPINNTYPIKCYHQAISHLPTDVQVYSSARDDIERALQQAIAAQHQPPTTTSAETTTATETTAPTTTSASGGHHTRTTTTTPTTTTPTTTRRTTTRPSTTSVAPTTTTKKKHKRSPVSNAIRDITPGGADSFPLPLLILGLLAILLVLAGVGGLVWRRIQGRGGMA